MVADPQAAVCCDVQGTPLNLVASESQPLQQAMVDLVRTRDAELTKITDRLPTLMLPDHHDIRRQDLDPRYLRKLFVRGLMRGAEGLRTVAWHTWPGAEESSRAIAGGGIDLCTPDRTRDPARFAFAHGGKDRIPYPVNQTTYEQTITILQQALNRAHVQYSDKARAPKRLALFMS